MQARELTDLLTLLDRAGIDGAFVFTFVSPNLPHHEEPQRDRDMASFSIVKSYTNKRRITYSDMPWEPKELFKAVASYYR